MVNMAPLRHTLAVEIFGLFCETTFIGLAGRYVFTLSLMSHSLNSPTVSLCFILYHIENIIEVHREIHGARLGSSSFARRIHRKIMVLIAPIVI